MTDEYRIWMEPVVIGSPPNEIMVDGGWLGQPNGFAVTINSPIYCRTTKDKAWIFRKFAAAKLIVEMSMKGYPCRAEPPITIHL